jgi:hypothetical protein
MPAGRAQRLSLRQLTTLFFDASGRLVDTRAGELTSASLADTLRSRHGAVPQGSP